MQTYKHNDRWDLLLLYDANLYTIEKYNSLFQCVKSLIEKAGRKTDDYPGTVARMMCELLENGALTHDEKFPLWFITHQSLTPKLAADLLHKGCAIAICQE
jgi:hypothetical protein